MPGPNPTSRISFGGATPVLRVSNAASRDDYVNALGFRVNFEFAGFFLSVSRGDGNLFLCQGDQGHRGAWVWIDGKDVDALYEEYKVSGARIRHPHRLAGRRVAGHVWPPLAQQQPLGVAGHYPAFLLLHLHSDAYYNQSTNLPTP
jgi:hypothetical protein